MKYKPLEVDDANVCMKCGSVQCAFCSEDVLSALEGFKHDTREFIENIPFSNGDWSINQFYEIIDKWFPSLKRID